MTGSDVYYSKQLGNILLLVCDARFYRRAPQVSRKDRNAILGEPQWNWLEALLAASQATFVVLASSSNFHRFGDEAWEQYPAAFERLRQLLAGRKGALIVSGDIHNNENYDESGVIELVSSGVSRSGFVFGGRRENYGIMDFDTTGVDVQFKGLKRREQAHFRIDLSKWRL